MTQDFLYYKGHGEPIGLVGGKTQNSGAYVFRPDGENATSIVGNGKVKIEVVKVCFLKGWVSILTGSGRKFF